MEKIKMLVIAPYEGLKEVVNNVAKKNSKFEITAVVGNLETGVNAVLNAAEQSYDMIMSRGGTTEVIEKSTLIPVINIDISGNDFSRTIAFTKNISKKSAVVGFSKITTGAFAARELLKSNIDIFTINSEQELVKKLEELRKSDYRVVVGDVITIEYANKMGFHGVLLTSGEESVRKAFEQAEKIYEYTKKYKTRCLFLEQLLMNNDQYILVFKTSHEIVYNTLNEQDSQFLKYQLLSSIENIVSTGCQQLLFHNEKYLYMAIGKLIEHVNNETYIVFYINKSSSFKFSNKAITIKNIYYASSYPTRSLGPYSEYLKETLKKVKDFYDQDDPILIFGEVGTGKDALAIAMCMMNEKKSGPMITIDCETIDHEDLVTIKEIREKLFKETNSATIYFRKLNHLSIENQKTLYSILISEGFMHNFRIISSISESLDVMMNQNRFHGKLGKLLGENRIYVPSLRERTEDIRDLTSYYINEANTKYGKQVVALDDKSIDMLINFHWVSNVEQLRRVIYHLVMFSDGAYIRSDDTKRILEEEQAIGAQENTLPWDLNKTLDQIAVDVIRAVIEQEKGNLSRTSKRLGISRSTIWRKLNENEKEL